MTKYRGHLGTLGHPVPHFEQSLQPPEPHGSDVGSVISRRRLSDTVVQQEAMKLIGSRLPVFCMVAMLHAASLRLCDRLEKVRSPQG